MPSRIGRFEILSDITHSSVGGVFKANDLGNNQVVALKTLRLDALGVNAPAHLQSLLQEAENTKVLNSHNITLLYGAGDLEGQYCAAMEYVQGNSIATMLARKEEFSIWDIQDIVRQACQGLDHAHAHRILHRSLEPAKLMVQWDGTVKLLSFGLSSMSEFAAECQTGTPEILHYMSPEQVRGDAMDGRSNLFSLGAILYEMLTSRKAFAGGTPEQVKQTVLDGVPVPPEQYCARIPAALSEIVMKALSKAPDERYQNGLELVRDLEQCRQNSATPAKAAAPEAAAPRSTPAAVPVEAPAVPAKKAAAAAAGAGSSHTVSRSEPPRADSSEQFVQSCIKASVEAWGRPQSMAPAAPPPSMAASPQIDLESPLASASPGTAGQARKLSFSEIDELPPLKESYAPPIPESQAPVAPEPIARPRPRPVKEQPEARELARKAAREIRNTPAKLYLYSLAGALVIILLVAGLVWHRISSDSSGIATHSGRPTLAAEAPNSVAAPSAISVAEGRPQSAKSGSDKAKATFISVQPQPKPRKPGKKQPPVTIVVPGQLSMNSSPEGAQVSIDGNSNAGWITPFNLSGIEPGQHTVVVSKAGYSPVTRTVDVGSKSKSFLVVQLMQLLATVAVTSDPSGSHILLDGHDTGKVTPSMISVDKAGNHSFQVKKDGYLDEGTNLTLQLGQTSHYAATLRKLGMTEEIKTAGRFKKLFGGGNPDGMGAITVKTQPRGAQIAVNHRVLDKGSPAEFYLNPGNYVIDITLTGYKSIHRVINVEKDGKIVVDEILDRE